MTTVIEKPNTPRRVFITGACGFIGRALARHYRELGSEVSGLDFTADPEWAARAGDLARGMRRTQAWARQNNLV